MNGADLTILLPLKGRNLFTMRFLWHANEQKVPYRIVIADAEPHPSVQKAIDNNTFSNLNIVYKVYPPDNTLQDFYAKMASAAELVKTPYVMQVDNDDFLVPSGLEYCIDCLDKNEDYVACSGLIRSMGFDDMTPSVIGSNFDFKSQNNKVCDINESLPLRRVIDGQVGKTGYYYSVIRTDAFAKIVKAIESLSLTYLLFHEFFFELSLLSFGKIKIDGSFCSYIRQTNTSMSGHYKSLEHLLESDLGSDSRKIKKYLIDECGIKDDEQGKKELDAFVKDWLVNIKLRNLLNASDYNQKVGRVKSASPEFVVKLFRVAYKTVNKISSLKVVKLNLLENSAPGYQATFDKEIDEIKNMLAGNELREFLERSFADSPDLLNELQAHT